MITAAMAATESIDRYVCPRTLEPIHAPTLHASCAPMAHRRAYCGIVCTSYCNETSLFR